ncbi:MAG: alpha/beta fold hydrolase [Pseudobdellovibrio sp.]
MQKHYILALHGFLGTGSDWNAVESALVRALPASSNVHSQNEIEWIKPDLFSNEKSFLKEEDFSSFEKITHRIYDFLSSYENIIFVGYSLGGRIGLHLLKEYPKKFKKFIIVSAHPGLESEAEIKQRETQDLLWKNKLQNLSWNNFLEEWQKQPVFAQDKDLKRNAEDFNRIKLELSLERLSLSQQGVMNKIIQKNQDKIQWIVGDLDIKFKTLAEDMRQKKILSNYERILNSGHRVIFDNPEELSRIILETLD